MVCFAGWDVEDPSAVPPKGTNSDPYATIGSPLSPPRGFAAGRTVPCPCNTPALLPETALETAANTGAVLWLSVCGVSPYLQRCLAPPPRCLQQLHTDFDSDSSRHRRGRLRAVAVRRWQKASCKGACSIPCQSYIKASTHARKTLPELDGCSLFAGRRRHRQQGALFYPQRHVQQVHAM